MSSISRVLSRIVGSYIHGTPEYRGKRQSLFAINWLFRRLPVRSAYGVDIMMDVFDRTNWYGISGKYGNTVSGEISKLREGDCFVDVGANCGVFSLMAAKRVGPHGLVVAFEPNLRTFSRLVENIRINNIQNVMALNLAVSDQTDFIQMDPGDPQHSGRSAIRSSSAPGGVGVGGISIADFPALSQLIGQRRVLIKIDVEGYEHRVLLGLRPILERQDTIGVIVEIDQANLERFGDTTDSVYGCLERYGFSATRRSRSDQHFDEVFQRPDTAIPADVGAERTAADALPEPVAARMPIAGDADHATSPWQAGKSIA